MESESLASLVEAAMPNISLDMGLRCRRFVGLIIGAHGPFESRGRQIADGFVRLVEKSILEYLASREQLIEYFKTGNKDEHFRAQDHFETSTQCLHRAIAYIGRIRNMGFLREDGTPFVPRPRDLEVLRQDVKDKIRTLRDFIEHLDEDIVGGRVQLTAEVGIFLSVEKASLNGAEITYIDFARWLTQLHYFADRLSAVNITVSPPIEQGRLG